MTTTNPPERDTSERRTIERRISAAPDVPPSGLPGYDVEFTPTERRLFDRRAQPGTAP
mgnify:FL=1